MKGATKFLLSLILFSQASSFAMATEYPSLLTKKDLGADNDYRGKMAPPLNVQLWLTTAPAYGDKVVLVDFWATWCGPCRGLIPELNGFQKKFEKDLIVIGLTNEKAAEVSKFMKEQKFDYSVGIDSKARAERALGVGSIPHVMIYTPDGRVRWQGFPGDRAEPLTEQVLERIITAYKERKSAKNSR